MAVAANLWAVGASHAGFIALLQSSSLYQAWNNLVLVITSWCFAPGVVPAFCSLSPALPGRLVLVVAPCCCLSPLISVMLNKCGRHWVLCRLRAGTHFRLRHTSEAQPFVSHRWVKCRLQKSDPEGCESPQMISGCIFFVFFEVFFLNFWKSVSQILLSLEDAEDLYFPCPLSSCPSPGAQCPAFLLILFVWWGSSCTTGFENSCALLPVLVLGDSQICLSAGAAYDSGRGCTSIKARAGWVVRACPWQQGGETRTFPW